MSTVYTVQIILTILIRCTIRISVIVLLKLAERIISVISTISIWIIPNIIYLMIIIVAIIGLTPTIRSAMHPSF